MCVYMKEVVTFFVVLLSVVREGSFRHAGAAAFLTLLITCLLCASVGRVDGMWSGTRPLCGCVRFGRCCVWPRDCGAAVRVTLALLTAEAAFVVVTELVTEAIGTLNTKQYCSTIYLPHTHFHDVVMVVVLFNLFLVDSLILKMCRNIQSLVWCTLTCLLVGRRDHGLAPIISSAATAKPLPTFRE